MPRARRFFIGLRRPATELRTVAECRRGHGCRSTPLLACQHGVAPTNQSMCKQRAYISNPCHLSRNIFRASANMSTEIIKIKFGATEQSESWKRRQGRAFERLRASCGRIRAKRRPGAGALRFDGRRRGPTNGGYHCIRRAAEQGVQREGKKRGKEEREHITGGDPVPRHVKPSYKRFSKLRDVRYLILNTRADARGTLKVFFSLGKTIRRKLGP